MYINTLIHKSTCAQIHKTKSGHTNMEAACKLDRGTFLSMRRPTMRPTAISFDAHGRVWVRAALLNRNRWINRKSFPCTDIIRSQLKSWEVGILDSWFLATLTQRPHAADKFGRRSPQTTNGQRNVCSDLQVNNWNSIQLSVLLSTTTRVEKKRYHLGQSLWGGWVLLGICLK